MLSLIIMTLKKGASNLLNDFSFSSVSDVRVGPGSSDELGACARGLLTRHVLVVTDAEIQALGLLDSALSSSLATRTMLKFACHFIVVLKRKSCL